MENESKYIYLTILTVILLVVGTVIGYQWFKVFSAEQSGKAEYARAEQNRQIAVLEAQAQNESATSQALAKIKIAEAEASAEIARARGVAESNTIIGDSLKGNEDYLRYLYINGLTQGTGQIIYIPTEAGLPILEAGKR
jgi:hypothetical protein